MDRIYTVAGIGVRFPRGGRMNYEQNKEVGRMQGVLKVEIPFSKLHISTTAPHHLHWEIT